MCIYLIVGVLLFGLTHLYPAVFAGSRKALMGKIGENPYKGVFSLLLLLSLFLIVYGWRITEATILYTPPEWGHKGAQILMLLALFLFISAIISSNIKRIVRHPQLSSIALWGFAHLLANGENRSIVLFGAFSVWAVVMIFFLNRRDGDWQKPDALPFSRDIIVGIIALAAYVGLAFGHKYFSGVSLM